MSINSSTLESVTDSTDSWVEVLPTALREFEHSPIHWAAIKEFAKNLRGTIPTVKVAGMNTLHARMDQLSQSRVEISIREGCPSGIPGH